MKYVDSEKLIAEIKKLLAKAKNDEVKAFAKKDAAGHLIAVTKTAVCVKIKKLIASLQQERPELPPIGYAETYYQKGLRNGIIKGQIEILKGLEDIENRKAEPVLVIKEQEQPEVDLEREIDAFFDKWDKNSNGGIFDENGAPVTIKTIKGVVKHFLNARKEE